MNRLIKFTLIAVIMGIFSLNGAEFTQDPNLVAALQGKKLIVIRQAESLNNQLGIVTSSKSPGYALTRWGKTLSKETAKGLSHKNVTILYTSPVYRAMQSAEIYGIYLNLPPQKLIPDAHLTVQEFGSYETQDFDAYKSLFSSFEAMLEGNAPGGEPGSSVFSRTKDFLCSLAGTPDQTILIITHAFNFCHIRMALTGQFGDLPAPGEHIIYDYTL
jgi:broad specificity phosphatase PhoE